MGKAGKHDRAKMKKTGIEAGKYIVVVWVTNVSPKDVPTIGWSVDIE